MLKRALSLRRKLLRALKVQLWSPKSSSLSRKSSSLSRKPDAVIDKCPSDIEDLEQADDGVPQIKYASVRPADPQGIIRCPPDIDVVPARDLASNTPLTIVVPPRPPVPVLAQSPLSTPESCDLAGPSRTRSNQADTQDFVAQVETFQSAQQQRKAMTRAQSMPLSVSDPMRKLRDSYVRIMHKMAQDEANANPLSPSSPLVAPSDQPRRFDYLHPRRCPADEEEEQFLNLAVMRTKFNRSQSAL